jgi:hypothetical protein
MLQIFFLLSAASNLLQPLHIVHAWNLLGIGGRFVVGSDPGLFFEVMHCDLCFAHHQDASPS